MTDLEDDVDPHHDGLWIDEQIWGHRLHDEQTPWLTFLEFLTVFRASGAKALAGHHKISEPLEYTPQRQMRLRNILFNNPHFMEMQESIHRGSADAWDRWIMRMSRKPSGQPDIPLNFADLREHFSDFQDFVRVVEYLRRTAVEGLANKRWTTRFVFPFGACALYEDVAEKGKSLQTDRLFFARTGELLYLMLSRSALATEVAEKIDALFFSVENPSHRLVCRLQGPTQPAPNSRSGAILPHETRPEFNALAEDWLALLSRDMAGLDVVPHLVTMAGLHLWRYLLNLAAEHIGAPPPRVVVEMVATQRTALRTLSADSYDENNALPWRAVESLLRGIQRRADWNQLTSGPAWRERLLDALHDAFRWPLRNDRAPMSTLSASEIINELLADAQKRHKGHFGKIHSTWARDMGLASRRSSRRVRYAPTDRLLKTLVLTRVESRLEFKRFLVDLYERYGFVIGEIQGEPWIAAGVADKEDFKRNSRRLEERLLSLGLAERLSDACAFVQSTVRLAQ
jgi:hypothetical protein